MKSCYRRVVVSIFIGLSALTGGCARQISPNVYGSNAVGEVSITLPGTIVQTRIVKVAQNEYMEHNQAGIIGGTLVGLAAANPHGTAKPLTAVSGALAGATAGAFTEKLLKNQLGVEYIVQVENGDLFSVVQGTEPLLEKDQKVWLIKSAIRSRVIVRDQM